MENQYKERKSYLSHQTFFNYLLISRELWKSLEHSQRTWDMMQGFSIKDLPCHFPFPTLPPLELFSHYPSPELGSLCTDVPPPPRKKGRGASVHRLSAEIWAFYINYPGWKLVHKLKTKKIDKAGEQPATKYLQISWRPYCKYCIATNHSAYFLM